MQILLFGDAVTFSDFIFKGTLITKTPNRHKTLRTRTLIGDLLVRTWTYRTVFGLGLGERSKDAGHTENDWGTDAGFQLDRIMDGKFLYYSFNRRIFTDSRTLTSGRTNGIDPDHENRESDGY